MIINCVSMRTSAQYIVDVFNNQNIADISVCLCPYTSHANRNTYVQRAYIQVNRWYLNVASRNLHDKVADQAREARVIYCDPHWWVLEKMDSITYPVYATSGTSPIGATSRDIDTMLELSCIVPGLDDTGDEYNDETFGFGHIDDGTLGYDMSALNEFLVY
jgi:hypothetical protein